MEAFVHQQVIFEVTATGFQTPKALENLGTSGTIDHIMARTPAGSDITSASIWIADKRNSPMTAVQPKDEHAFYENETVAVTASDTEAFLADNLKAVGGSDYVVKFDGDAAVGLEVLAKAGAVEYQLIVDVWARASASRAS